MNKIDRTGFKFVNNDGAEFEIIEYRNTDDLDVQFLKSGKIYKNKRYCDCERGRIKDCIIQFILIKVILVLVNI